jgi:hypothetical protein
MNTNPRIHTRRVMRTAAAAAALCLWAGASAWTARAQSAAQEPATPMDKPFTVLLERSIFSKDGRSRSTSRPATTTASTAPTARPLTPEQANVFRGVLCPDQEYVAFIENIQNNQINVLKTGDEIAGGRIAAITLDTMNFATGGKVHEIKLGQNLAGETVSSTTTGSSFAGTTRPASSSGPVDPATAAIQERMRLKRLQEGGR